MENATANNTAFETYQRWISKQNDIINGLGLLKDKCLHEKATVDEMKATNPTDKSLLKDYYTEKLKDLTELIKLFADEVKVTTFERWNLQNYKPKEQC
jgi:hypothetical protein